MADQSKHYLITGGSGFLGINLIRYLLERGHKISSIDLVPFDYEDCVDKINWVEGDIRDRAAMDKITEGVDIIVHCAAALPLYTPEEIFSTDVDGTRIVCEAAENHGVERMIHISSTAVYGVPDHHPLYEDDDRHGVGPYGEAKVLAEDVVMEFRDKGMFAPIIRPKSFIGPERLGVFAMFYEYADEGHNFPMLGKGLNPYQFLDVEDLCDAIYLCATLPAEAANDTFNIGAGEYNGPALDFQAVLDQAGKGKRMVSLPVKPAVFVLRILEAMNMSPLYKWIYETWDKESFVSIERAQQKLGWQPKYSNIDALLRNYQWYLDNKDTFEEASGVTHRVPWKQGALALGKLVF